MPELPEVETVRRSLIPHLPGRVVSRVEVRVAKLVEGGLDPARLLPGQAFAQPQRVGKRLILPLERHTLLIHLGMTGQLTFRDPSRADQGFQRHPVTGLQRTLQHPVDKHTHISLYLTDGTEVHYRDIRKFGRFTLVEPQQVAQELAGLGPDPLTPDYTFEGFRAAMRATRRAVKAALLDQGVVAGVGNIYADEALYRAGLRPGRTAQRLSEAALRRLFEAVPEVLKAGVEHGGTTLSDYVNADGQPGSHQELLQVYGRYGQPCLRCQTPLKRTLVAQRTSSWCPRCQR